MDITVLRDINDWWVTGRVKNSLIEPVPRSVTPEIIRVMDERQIILLEGPRRVGKTSIIFHLIKSLIDSGIDPKRIIYISLDDPLISKEKFFESLIDVIETYLTGSRVHAKTEMLYLFLDEVIHLKDWGLHLKRYYDQRYPFKFVISSSAASFLVKKGRESLVGRIFRFNITPFSFSEFLRLKSAEKEIIDLQENVSRLWKDFFVNRNSEALWNGLTGLSRNEALRRKEIDLYLRQFLLNGGFPEFLRLKEERSIRQYFPENIIERVVYHDIPEAFQVADRGLLQTLLLYSVFHSGSIININEIAASHHATRQTVSDYLHYLQASMLVRLLEKYAKTEASRLRAFRKLYTIDTGLYIHLQRLTPAQIEEKGIAGSLAEIAVFAQLHSYLGPSGRIFYFREKEAEVDFVAEIPGGLIPIEVKYRETPKDIKGIKYFRERFKRKPAIVITKDTFSVENNTLFVPLRLFL